MKNFNPMGMIPAFNAWGNHPNDMELFVKEKVKVLYQNLGLSGYQSAEAILLNALDALSLRPETFTGHYTPCPVTRIVKEWLVGTFVKADECKLFGLQNYQKALRLISEGHNVLGIMNHATALDCLIAESLTSQIRPVGLEYSYIASQVFEYSRISSIATSGFDKFPVFQPKHFEKMMKNNADKDVINGMVKQNKTTLRSLCQNLRQGSKFVFLFPERDRSPVVGFSEPVVAQLPYLFQKASVKELYILPTFVSGGETIFPNMPGTNELDNFLQNLKVGYGNMYCGEPIPLSKICNTLDCIDKKELIREALGEVPSCKEYLHLSAFSVLILGSIAALSPVLETRGIYNNNRVQKIIEVLRK